MDLYKYMFIVFCMCVCEYWMFLLCGECVVCGISVWCNCVVIEVCVSVCVIYVCWTFVAGIIGAVSVVNVWCVVACKQCI